MADNPTTNLNPDYNQKGFATANDKTQIPSAINETQGILDQTLGEVLSSNPQAQQMIMQSMHLSPGQFQDMLGDAQKNNMMHMKIRDLFNQSIVQKAVSQQQGQPISAEQLQQIENPDGIQNAQTSSSQMTSFSEKLKGWLGKFTK